MDQGGFGEVPVSFIKEMRKLEARKRRQESSFLGYPITCPIRLFFIL